MDQLTLLLRLMLGLALMILTIKACEQMCVRVHTLHYILQAVVIDYKDLFTTL